MKKRLLTAMALNAALLLPSAAIAQSREDIDQLSNQLWTNDAPDPDSYHRRLAELQDSVVQNDAHPGSRWTYISCRAACRDVRSEEASCFAQNTPSNVPGFGVTISCQRANFQLAQQTTLHANDVLAATGRIRGLEVTADSLSAEVTSMRAAGEQIASENRSLRERNEALAHEIATLRSGHGLTRSLVARASTVRPSEHTTTVGSGSRSARIALTVRVHNNTTAVPAHAVADPSRLAQGWRGHLMAVHVASLASDWRCALDVTITRNGRQLSPCVSRTNSHVENLATLVPASVSSQQPNAADPSWNLARRYTALPTNELQGVLALVAANTAGSHLTLKAFDGHGLVRRRLGVFPLVNRTATAVTPANFRTLIGHDHAGRTRIEVPDGELVWLPRGLVATAPTATPPHVPVVNPTPVLPPPAAPAVQTSAVSSTNALPAQGNGGLDDHAVRLITARGQGVGVDSKSMSPISRTDDTSSLTAANDPNGSSERPSGIRAKDGTTSGGTGSMAA